MRDIAIIIIAIQSIVIGVLLGVLIWQIWRLVKIVQTEIRPIIEDTQATVNTVRGTATFMSNNVVDPVIRSTSGITRWRSTFRALTGDLTATMRPPARPASPPPPAAPPGNSPS
jgi:hypothetical protein